MGFIRTIDNKGKGHKFQVHFHSIQKTNELYIKILLLGKHRKIFVDLDLIFLQREKNREVLFKLDEVNKCHCENGKLHCGIQTHRSGVSKNSVTETL